MRTDVIVNDFLKRWRSDLLDTAGEIALVVLIDGLLSSQREADAQIAEGFIPSGFTGMGKLGNAFAVARDDRARSIAWRIRNQHHADEQNISVGQADMLLRGLAD